MRRLFEMEVPEVGEKIVEIMDIARDPGFRAKVVVRSHNPKVDPVGACVGIRGSRIRSIMNELSGERIDLIAFSDDTQTFISNSIAPAKANSVMIIDKDQRQAEVIVPNDQLALTIGRDGQNIRLACKLTGWSLAVKSEAQKADSQQKAADSQMEMLSVLKGIGPKTSEVLLKSGREWEYPVEWGVGLQAEHERYLTEEYYKKPLILTGYPKDVAAFYMRLNDDGKTVRAMDVLVPRIGEIIGGSQREERLDVLEKRMNDLDMPIEEYDAYLDLRRYGSVEHSGFGLGFGRLIMFLTGMKNHRDVIAFPRSPRNLEF
jgi:transcription antitermination factor NusA-like protein